LGAAVFAHEDKAQAPTIVFEGLTKDFGKAAEGETLKHIFRFKNKGASPLVIQGVEAT
jgi:hypothetical protein